MSKHPPSQPPLRLNKILDELKQQATAVSQQQGARNASTHHLTSIDAFLKQKPPKRIDEEIRALQIANNITEEDQRLKRSVLRILLRLLFGEIIVVFVIAFMQGFHWNGFYLEEWSFRILVAVTILQITAMLTIAVQHLFPKKNNPST